MMSGLNKFSKKQVFFLKKEKNNFAEHFEKSKIAWL